jgi:exopolysaccharide biosynthesis polyprenyl glycosylphosphotransferase
MRVTTVIGAKQEAMASGLGHLWKGTYDDASEIFATTDVDVVVLCSAELDRWQLHDLSADAAARGRMLYVDPGLSGIDFKRVHTTAIGHQPLLEMSAPSLSSTQAVVKRSFDVAVAGIVATLAAPVLIVAALLIKLDDGGPVFFRQRRVGRDGQTFEILKFRTMVVDAEARLADLTAENERRGPLFKMDRDPRITRIGRFLRATSLDELPQLLNVLNGTMSLVGPRPALPSEVAEFPVELNARHRVRPGITGLWQVEARDNPSFEAYVRLDLFYVQNWTPALDLIILLGTIDHIVLRPIINALYRGEDDRRKQAASALGAEQQEDAVAVL